MVLPFTELSVRYLRIVFKPQQIRVWLVITRVLTVCAEKHKALTRRAAVRAF